MAVKRGTASIVKKATLILAFSLAMISAFLIFFGMALFIEFKLHLLGFASATFPAFAITVVALGIIAVMTSILGCIGSLIQIPALVTFYALINAGLVIIQAYGLITGFEMLAMLRSRHIEASDLSSIYQTYKTDFVVKGQWDELQQHFQCCGAHGTHAYSFWMNIEPFQSQKSVPDSCCLIPMKNCGVDLIGQPGHVLASTIYMRGCLDVVQEDLNERLQPLLFVFSICSLLLCIFYVINIILSCQFASALRRDEKDHFDQLKRRNQRRNEASKESEQL